MSLFNFDNGACKRCPLNGKCEEQKVIAKSLSALCGQINIDMPDNETVGTIVVVCNRGGVE